MDVIIDLLLADPSHIQEQFDFVINICNSNEVLMVDVCMRVLVCMGGGWTVEN